jgi:hypothetical protein
MDSRRVRAEVPAPFGTGNEPFAVEGGRREPPAEAADDQQRRRTAKGNAERLVDHVGAMSVCRPG